MKIELNNFFTNTVLLALDKLKSDSKASWGTMNAEQMLIHLIQSTKMMHLGNTKLLIKEKHIEKAIAFLYTDKPISRGIEIPKNIGYNLDNTITEDIEATKEDLINSINNMLSFLSKNTDFKAMHPFFGELNTDQWLLFQKKHFTHHLIQFGLM
jgi:hypothetical protein